MKSSSPAARPRRALQRRSQITADAILEAGRTLLRLRDFDDVSVAEVAQLAGVSVGGFYARFEGKDALLHALAADILMDCASALERALAPGRIGGASIERVVRAYVRVMVRKFREHRNALLQIMRHVRSGDPVHGLAVRDFNDRVHGRLLTLLDERQSQMAHPNPEVAARFGLFLVSAGAREAVLSDSLRAVSKQVADETLIDELTRAYVAYLQAQAPRGRTRR